MNASRLEYGDFDEELAESDFDGIDADIWDRVCLQTPFYGSNCVFASQLPQ
jgi:hypothetical protein